MGAPALVKFSIVAMSKEVAPFYPVTLLDYWYDAVSDKCS